MGWHMRNLRPEGFQSSFLRSAHKSRRSCRQAHCNSGTGRSVHSWRTISTHPDVFVPGRHQHRAKALQDVQRHNHRPCLQHWAQMARCSGKARQGHGRGNMQCETSCLLRAWTAPSSCIPLWCSLPQQEGASAKRPNSTVQPAAMTADASRPHACAQPGCASAPSRGGLSAGRAPEHVVAAAAVAAQHHVVREQGVHVGFQVSQAWAADAKQTSGSW